MEEPNPIDYLSDPLSDIARKERRNLLIAGTVGILVAEAGIIPTKFSAFGITLSSPAQDTFVLLVGLTVLYFICAFITYGFADFLIWRTKYQDYLEHVQRYMGGWTREDQQAYDDFRDSVPSIAWLYKVSGPTAFIRIFFEFGVPIIFGVISAALIWLKLWIP